MSDLFDFKEYTEELSLIVNARQSKVSTKDLISYIYIYILEDKAIEIGQC